MDHGDDSKIRCGKKGLSCSCHPCLKVCLEAGSAGREPCEAFPGDETSGSWEADMT
jgi:hypothetical protein